MQKKRGCGISNRSSMLGQNKGQVTIFIIIAILIIAGIGIFFLFRSDIIPEFTGRTGEVNVNAFLNECLNQRVKDVAEELSLEGGYSNNPNSVNFKFTEEGVYRNISYLCYTQNNFRPCIVQKPTFFLDIQKNIESKIEGDVETCFNEMVNSLRDQGFEVGSNKLNSFEVNFEPRKIIVQTDSEVTLTKSGETETQKNFQILIPSRIYEILDVAQEIVDSESEFCYFEVVGFQLSRPEFSIDLFRMEDSTEIYTIEHEDSQEKFRFAVRGCDFVV